MNATKTEKALHAIAWVSIVSAVIASIALFNVQTVTYASDIGELTERHPYAWLFSLVALLAGAFWSTLFFAASQILEYIRESNYYDEKTYKETVRLREYTDKTKGA